MEIDIQRQQGDFLINTQFNGAESGVTALFGPSGAGKTSIVNMVSGLMRPDSGRIAVGGLCLFDAQRGIDLPPERRRIGYVFQDGRLLPHLSVRSNLVYGMRLTPVSRRFVQFDAVVELLGINHLLDRRPAKLSGGEKQRVAIGRALLTSPAMLLMDEPLASLDASRKAEVMPFIMRLSREFAIPTLYVSHSLDEILNLADQLVILDAGTVVASGDLGDLLSQPEMQKRLGSDEIGAVIETEVEAPQDDSGMTRLRFGNQTLIVPPIDAPQNGMVRVHIAARHVAIALEPPANSSFQNVFLGRVQEIVYRGGALIDIRIDIGCPLWARITRKSFLDLEIKPGQSVCALIKSVAVSLGGRADISGPVTPA